MTPTELRTAGELLNRLSWTDKELEQVIDGLRYVIPWLEGAGYSKRIISPLRMELTAILRIQYERTVL